MNELEDIIFGEINHVQKENIAWSHSYTEPKNTNSIEVDNSLVVARGWTG